MKKQKKEEIDIRVEQEIDEYRFDVIITAKKNLNEVYKLNKKDLQFVELRKLLSALEAVTPGLDIEEDWEFGAI